MSEPVEAVGDPGAKTASLKAAIASQGIALEYVRELDGALGTSSGGRIQVVVGLQPVAEFMVLAHEYAQLCSAVGYVQLADGARSLQSQAEVDSAGSGAVRQRDYYRR